MSSQFLRPTIGFVWRAAEISSSVVDVARRTGSRAIFDLSASDFEQSGLPLLQANATADAVDLKISPEALMSPGLEELLNETELTRVWVEIHPLLLHGDPAPILTRIAQLSESYDIIPVLGDLALIARIVNEFPAIKSIALKGNEAAGFGSGQTAFILYSAVRELIRAREAAPDLYIWGGIATPEAAAAFLATGAGGIVCESLHWLTDLVEADEGVRAKISKLRPDHTELTGVNLEVPCRFFNKGNSKAVKELRDFAGSLCGAEIRDEQRLFFAGRIAGEAVHPLESKLDREQLIPIGVEAAFAESFVRRFGHKTEEAVDRFVKQVERVLAQAPSAQRAFVDSPVAKQLGTKYPFIQGAMSWITDVPEFARKVADAGALPTVALGMMTEEILEEKLGRLRTVMGDLPYAVNVITLAENPHRDSQLAWIRGTKPRFAVIAAGEPSHAAELMAAGVEVIYIAPNEELLKMALSAGIRYCICEGNEAGGHVGQHSTLTLAQMVLDLKDREPALFEGRRIILAGGICNRETAFMIAMLGADAVQMGTVYLTSREIIETGALTQAYQGMILEAGPGTTTVTGEGTGLRVRSLKTDKIEAICSLERDFAAGAEDEASFRMKIETLSAGSLFIAARGLDKPGGVPLQAEECKKQGQFMSGACAGVLRQPVTLRELHQELAQGDLAEGLPFAGPIRTVAADRPVGIEFSEVAAAHSREQVHGKPSYAPERERIAITGMSIVNALGNSREEVWAASLAMKSGVVPVPPTRWNHEIFYHPRPRMPEKTYCKVGAFQTVEVSRKDIGVPPQDFRTMTDATKISMWLAAQAVEESGILESNIPRERIGVLISQNSGEAAATLQDVIIRGSLTSILSAVKRVLQLTPEMEEAIAEQVTSGRIAIDDTTLLGRLNCSAGGFICNKYGFQGPSFSVSAACATALVALFSAYQMIRNGVLDAAIVGGGEEFLTPMHFLEFSALGALAGLSGQDRPPAETSRPFDTSRDGMVLGEGGGMIVIERESIARSRGAKILAFITSMGASNNNLGMVESSKITQEIAIRSSFRDASYGPEAVDLVECHATSTRQGDAEEVQALQSFFNSGSTTTLTSFKSQIGHTLGASGINSLIRGVMAMNSAVFPPTLNYLEPDPEMKLEGSGLVVHPQPVDWKSRNGSPRRLQVNAFGFGGSNYVVQLEQATDSQDMVIVPIPEMEKEAENKLSGTELPDGLHLFRTQIGGKSYRVAVVADTPADAEALIGNSEPFSNGGGVASKRLKSMARQGIHLGLADDAAPNLAFVFPGQGSHYAGMGHELYETFPVVRHWMDRAAQVAEFDLLHLLFHDREEDLQKTRWQQPALFTMEYAMVQNLISLGVKPTALAGHSLGELTALCLAGVYSFEDGFRIVNMRAICMDKACTMNVDPGVMMAADAPMDVLETLLSSWDDVYITNINSPHQLVVGGNTENVKAMSAELKAMGYRSTLLRVSMAFHSPIMRCIHDELEAFIADIPFYAPKIPVVSNTTTKPFPQDTKEIKRIVMAHLESPVHWMQNVSSLWNEYDVRLFVEVGPREILSNLIKDINEDAECIHTCLPSAEALIYKTALAQLYAKGNLPVQGQPKFVSFPTGAKSAEQDRLMAPKSKPVSQPVPATLEQTVQREINSFVLESFGRFLKPALLASIQRGHDAGFTEERLDQLLGQMFPAVGALPSIPSIPVPSTIQVPAHAAIQAVPVVSTEAAPAKTEPSRQVESEDVTESVIRIIMDATGYDREEIEPDMDLREDLSIRSSRLPVIMDSVEAHFGIKIELEDFMDVRTIRDIADRISAISARTKPKKTAELKPTAEVPGVETSPAMEPVEDKQSLKRLVFREVPLEGGDLQPVEVDLLDSIVIFSAGGGAGLRNKVSNVFRRDYGVTPVPVAVLADTSASEEQVFDLLTSEGQSEAVAGLAGLESLAGIVFVVDDALESRLGSVEAVSRMIEGMFVILKTFLESSARKFAILIHKCSNCQGTGRVLAEGVLGMFLSAALEFSSVQFRTVRFDEQTDLRDAIRAALDRSRKPIEMTYREGEAFTTEGQTMPASFQDVAGLEIHPGDVVVFSGGGYGITPYIARSLVPFGCRIVLLGRTALDSDIDYQSLSASDEAVEKLVKKRKPQLVGEARAREVARIKRIVEIGRTIEQLRAAGTDASYFRCDVTNAEQTKTVLSQIIERYGKIDGIVHAAGVLRDGFVKQMPPEDFSDVVKVKLLGAWNLLAAAKKSDLKFFVGFSSAAAIQGNPGQANYAAANRIMSALLAHLRAKDDSIRYKALMLPPIEGAGMAENADVRAMMQRMNASYVHVEELAGLFTRELFVAPSQDVWVMFMRSLPDLSSVRLMTSDFPPGAGKIRSAAMTFKNEDLPMIDALSTADLVKGELTAVRSFSQKKDLWVHDHKPFKFLKNPLVSAIMALETFMEACRILFPHLRVRAVRDAQFLDIIECPAEVTRDSEIFCRRLKSAADGVQCEVTLSTREISPSGRIMDRKSVNYRAVVVLTGDLLGPPVELPGFPVRVEELDSRPMDHEEALEWYRNRTDMQERYRVIEGLDGTSTAAVRGRMIYHQGADFAPPLKTRYQYSPYLLEALMQMVNFYIAMRDPDEPRAMIPYRIGEMTFFRKVASGEEITLEACMKNRDDEGITWTARALDETGRTVMIAKDIMMRWFAK